jgi:hypothetical protein
MPINIMEASEEMMLLMEMQAVVEAVEATAVEAVEAPVIQAVVVAEPEEADMYEPLQIMQLYGHIALPQAAPEIVTQLDGLDYI